MSLIVVGFRWPAVINLMDWIKTQIGFVVYLCSNALAGVLCLILLRGFELLPSWSFQADLLAACGLSMLCLLVSRMPAAVGVKSELPAAELPAAELPASRLSDAGCAAPEPRPNPSAMVHLSHEIRSPMNALLGYVRLLKNGQVRDAIEQRQHLDVIHRSGLHVLQLMDQVLDHATLQNGSRRCDYRSGSIFSVLEETREMFQLQAAEKGLLLNLIIPGSLPSAILMDRLKLQQLLNNLISNAIKFTDVGFVNIYASLLRQNEGDCLEIKIVDSGLGMSAEQLPQIFSPFIQLPLNSGQSHSGQSHSGAGLGLAITRDLTEVLGGRLAVESAVGTGTVFTLQLKIEIADGAVSMTHHQFSETNDLEKPGVARSQHNLLSGLRVMIVDDDVSHRRLFQLYLENRGAETCEAINGQQALEVVGREKIDLVLVDMQMPVMDGVATTRSLRERGFRQPIIGVSAHSESFPGLDGVRQEFSGWLQKPIDSRRLDLLLNRALQERAGRLAHEKPNGYGESVVGNSPEGMVDGNTILETSDQQITAVQIPDVGDAVPALHYSVHSAHSGKNCCRGPLVSGDLVDPNRVQRSGGPAQTFYPSWPACADGFADIVPLFLETLRSKLDEVKNRGENSGDDVIKSFVHWLKGTAATCGLGEFAAPVEELERAMRERDDASCSVQLLEIEAIAEAFELLAEAH